jgi:hypothetical protein
MRHDSLKKRGEAMFTKTELDAAANMVSSKKLFLHQPFTLQFSNDVRSEADFYFFRGAKQHYKHAAHFWLHCINWLEDDRRGFQLLHRQRYPHRRAAPINVTTNFLLDASNLYKYISPETFQAAIEEYSLQLKYANIPHTYHWEGQVQLAMQMSDEWNDQSFIAETESEFLVFHWETSA